MSDFSNILSEIRDVRGEVREVRELREELQRYKGFVGGVVWCFSAFTALLGFAWGALSGQG